MSINLGVSVFSWLNSGYAFWEEYHRSKTYNRWCLIAMRPITGHINIDPMLAFSIIITLSPIPINVLEGISFGLWKYSILPWDFYPLVFTSIMFLGRVNKCYIDISWSKQSPSTVLSWHFSVRKTVPSLHLFTHAF